MPYDVVVRYQTQVRGDWDVARITIERPDGYELEGSCSNAHPSYEQNVAFALPEGRTSVAALSNICLEKDKVYKVKLYFERHRQNEDNPAAQILIDSVSGTKIRILKVIKLFFIKVMVKFIFLQIFTTKVMP